MAKPKPAAAAAEKAEPPAKSSKKMIIIIAAALLVLGGGGGGAWFFMKSKNGEAKPAHVEKHAPVFATLEPFTVNLLRENGEHFLQMGITYQVENDKIADSIKTYLPVIRSRILLLLSSKRPSDLADVKGKEKLVAEVLTVAREALPEGATPERGVDSAFLASFVVQ